MYLGSLKEKETALRGPMAEMNVIIDPKIYTKIMHWVHKAPGEISGLGKVEVWADGTLFVTSAYLLEQVNTGASTELAAADIAKLMYESREDAGHLNFWWHSHVNMGVFWSGTDIDTIREIGGQGFVVATVFNKKNEMKSAFYRKAEGLFPEAFVDDLETKIQVSFTQDEKKEWDELYEKKCKTRAYEYPKPTSHYPVRAISESSWTGDEYEGYGNHHEDDTGDLFTKDRNANDFIKMKEDDELEEKIMDQIDVHIEAMVGLTNHFEIDKLKNKAHNDINHARFSDKERRADLRIYVNQMTERAKEGRLKRGPGSVNALPPIDGVTQ